MGAMKKLPCIVALLLGVAFMFYGLNFFLKFVPTPSPEPGTPAANFIGAMYVSGYLTVIKVLEVIGGALLIFPGPVLGVYFSLVRFCSTSSASINSSSVVLRTSR